MSREQYYIYPKDKQGKRTGHCICVIVREGMVFHGISLCAEDDQFVFSVGRALALERAEAAYRGHQQRSHKTFVVSVSP